MKIKSDSSDISMISIESNKYNEYRDYLNMLQRQYVTIESMSKELFDTHLQSVTSSQYLKDILSELYLNENVGKITLRRPNTVRSGILDAPFTGYVSKNSIDSTTIVLGENTSEYELLDLLLEVHTNSKSAQVKYAKLDEILKKKLLSAKVYEQAIGFMRVIDGDNILDITPIHPESYDATIELLSSLGLTVKDIGSDELINKLDNLDMAKYCEEKKIDKYTLEDIVKCLKQPNRDFRDDFPKPLLKSDILKIEDLKRGMELQGTVRNVVDFGVFIDIGLHDDGLAHISKLTKDYIKHPMEVVNVGDIVNCYVYDIDVKKQKVSLSLIKPEEI